MYCITVVPHNFYLIHYKHFIFRFKGCELNNYCLNTKNKVDSFGWIFLEKCFLLSKTTTAYMHNILYACIYLGYPSKLISEVYENSGIFSVL